MKIAPSVWFGGATTFAFGAVGFWLAGLNSLPLVALCFASGVIATLCLVAAFREYYIRVGEERHIVNALSGPATSADNDSASRIERAAETYPEDAAPNIVAVMVHGGRVHLDHSSKELRPGDGTRFDTPYAAAIVPYRNDPSRKRKVGDAFEVKARVAVGNQAYPVTGYWLQSDRDHIAIPVGGSARELVVALCDRDGRVYLVDDHRDENNFRPAELLLLWAPTMAPDAFAVEIQLISDGSVLAEHRYSLTPRPFDLTPDASVAVSD